MNPSLPFDLAHPPAFDGDTFDKKQDAVRLTGQALRVFRCIQGGAWWMLSEISTQADAPESSVSARLRDFRKPRFGGHTIERRRVGSGTWEYRLIVNPQFHLELKP